MERGKRCWIADYGEFAENALQEIEPGGVEPITVVDGRKTKQIRAWHISIGEAIKLRAHLLHGGMSADFTVYVKKKKDVGPCRKLDLSEWWPDAIARKNESRGPREAIQDRLRKNRKGYVRGKVGTIRPFAAAKKTTKKTKR